MTKRLLMPLVFFSLAFLVSFGAANAQTQKPRTQKSQTQKPRTTKKRADDCEEFLKTLPPEERKKYNCIPHGDYVPAPPSTSKRKGVAVPAPPTIDPRQGVGNIYMRPYPAGKPPKETVNIPTVPLPGMPTRSAEASVPANAASEPASSAFPNLEFIKVNDVAICLKPASLCALRNYAYSFHEKDPAQFRKWMIEFIRETFNFVENSDATCDCEALLDPNIHKFSSLALVDDIMAWTQDTSLNLPLSAFHTSEEEFRQKFLLKELQKEAQAKGEWSFHARLRDSNPNVVKQAHFDIEMYVKRYGFTRKEIGFPERP